MSNMLHYTQDDVIATTMSLIVLKLMETDRERIPVSDRAHVAATL